MDQTFFDLRSRHFGHRFARDHDEVNVLGQIRLQLCERLADFPFDGIPHHGIADLFSDGQADTEMRLLLLMDHIDHELAVRLGYPTVKYFLKFFFLFDTKRFSHALPSNLQS